MILLKIKLENFKGDTRFIDLKGEKRTFFGTNATRKTTLKNAFLWALTGKDSKGRSNYQIRPRDRESWEIIHNVDASVELTLDVDGTETTLKRLYKEKWTKKRGSTSKEFTGLKTEFWVNGVPKNKKEYEDFISKMVKDPEMFQLITDTSYFNERLKWTERREMLIKAAGDVSDADVISSDPALSIISEIIEKRTVDDHKKVLAASRKKINDRLIVIPERIDEAVKSKPSLEGIDFDSVTARRLAKEKEKAVVDADIAKIENGGTFVAERKAKIATIEGEKIKAENLHESGINERLKPFRDAITAAEDKESACKNNLKKANEAAQEQGDKCAAVSKKISELESEMASFKNWHMETSSKTYTGTSDPCPHCGALPENQLDKSEETFNNDKAELLKKIIGEAEELRGKINTKKAEKLELEKSAEENEKLLKILKENVEKAKNTVEAEKKALSDQKTAPFDSSEYDNKIASLKAEIASQKETTEAELFTLNSKKTEIQGEIDELSKTLANIGTVEAANKRIKDLEDEQKQLAGEYESLEEEMSAVENFTRKKAAMLSDKINSMFTITNFKLFEDQLNGGLKECCEAMDNGVEAKGTNSGQGINIALDIINTFSKIAGWSAPIFIDNAESVVDLLPTEGQQIRLVVSADHKQLTMEA